MLEQWEIDLRNTLAGIQGKANKPSKPKKEKAQVVVRTETVLPKWLIGLFVGVFVLGTAYNYQLRTGKEIFKMPDWHFPRMGVLKEIDALNAKTDAVAAKVDALNKEVDRQNEKVTLLGTLHNEQEISRIRGDGTTILFNEDWSISKMPKYLKLDEEDLKFLQGHVKK